MKYAFVALSIMAVWSGVILMGVFAPAANLLYLHHVALILTVALFWIGFRGR